jgi:hypothetical protein
MTTDQQLEARDARRHAAQARAEVRREKREAIAEKMIGELSSGRFYVWPVGGKYREAAAQYELVQYLLRNKYA